MCPARRVRTVVAPWCASHVPPATPPTNKLTTEQYLSSSTHYPSVVTITAGARRCRLRRPRLRACGAVAAMRPQARLTRTKAWRGPDFAMHILWVPMGRESCTDVVTAVTRVAHARAITLRCESTSFRPGSVCRRRALASLHSWYRYVISDQGGAAGSEGSLTTPSRPGPCLRTFHPSIVSDHKVLFGMCCTQRCAPITCPTPYVACQRVASTCVVRCHAAARARPATPIRARSCYRYRHAAQYPRHKFTRTHRTAIAVQNVLSATRHNKVEQVQATTPPRTQSTTSETHTQWHQQLRQPPQVATASWMTSTRAWR